MFLVRGTDTLIRFARAMSPARIAIRTRPGVRRAADANHRVPDAHPSWVLGVRGMSETGSQLVGVSWPSAEPSGEATSKRVRSPER